MAVRGRPVCSCRFSASDICSCIVRWFMDVPKCVVCLSLSCRLVARTYRCGRVPPAYVAHQHILRSREVDSGKIRRRGCIRHGMLPLVMNVAPLPISCGRNNLIQHTFSEHQVSWSPTGNPLKLMHRFTLMCTEESIFHTPTHIMIHVPSTCACLALVSLGNPSRGRPCTG